MEHRATGSRSSPELLAVSESPTSVPVPEYGREAVVLNNDSAGDTVNPGERASPGMYRRALLVALGGLSGCTGAIPNPLGGDADSTGSDPAGDGPSAAAGTDTPTTTATATASDPTATATPSTAELRRLPVADLLVIGRERIDAAVRAYGGDEGSLTAVTARSDSFDPEPVVTNLYHARRAYEAANRPGVTAEQEATIQQLRRLDAAVRLLIDVQVLLVDAHTDLEEMAAAVELVDPETATSLAKRVGSRQDRTATRVAALSTRQYELSVAAIDELSRPTFVEKQQQLAAETSALGAIDEALPSVVTGVSLLARAQGKRTSGSPYTAATLARDAATDLGRGAADLRAAADRIHRRGRGLLPVARELVSVTQATQEVAETLTDSIGPDGG
jgi:hypothetical protein